MLEIGEDLKRKSGDKRGREYLRTKLESTHQTHAAQKSLDFNIMVKQQGDLVTRRELRKQNQSERTLYKLHYSACVLLLPPSTAARSENGE